MADCTRILRHDVVLVKRRISLVTSNENARSATRADAAQAPDQAHGQVNAQAQGKTPKVRTGGREMGD